MRRLVLLLWWCLSTPLLGDYAPRLEGPFADEAACRTWQRAHSERVSVECWWWDAEAGT